ncbi:MAG: WxcM-like domain-containing protein, partial [Muribaculaceae bacterium]
GSVCLVMASDLYDEADYVRTTEEFSALTSKKI